MQRSSYMFRVHHQVFPSLAVSRGSQVSPPSCGPPLPPRGRSKPCRLWRAGIFTAVRCHIGSSPQVYLEFSDSFLLYAIFSAEPVSDRIVGKFSDTSDSINVELNLCLLFHHRSSIDGGAGCCPLATRLPRSGRRLSHYLLLRNLLNKHSF